MWQKIKSLRASAEQRREREAQLKKEGRVPPGQRLTQKFPVLHIGPIPPFDPASWIFKIWGLVDRPVRWTWDEFQQLPRTKITLDIHCVTQWSKYDTVWEGVSLQSLLDAGYFQIKPEATTVLQHAEKGYTTNLPLSQMLQDNFLLATHYNGEPLTPEHGYPLRGVTGHIVGRRDLEDVYLWKGAKWLRGLQFLAEDKPGFWEVAGYHNEGNVWKEERNGRRWGK